ncbi:ComEC/Rec2 family competence protein [Candidatus Amesbacteria bacterium]|nr:ComEC/Rec2 family competence protein [Candidatus Amesbacteria bacterium]MBI2587651.1 ComEC/Rec2 family competence protein [Candidatus Amesbacteria bacterium]
MGADKRIGVGVVMALVMLVRVGWWKRTEVKVTDGQRIKISARVRQIPITVSGIFVAVPEEINVEYGDKIEVVGTVEERVTADGRRYLRLIDQDLRKIEIGGGWGRYLAGIRQKTFYNLRRWLGGDEGELAGGIVVGGSGEMSQEGRDNFRRTGVAHILAASGYNVSVVAGVILTTMSMVTGRKWAMWFVILGVCLYMFLAGMSAAVVRAGIMGTLAVLGLMLGRKGDGYWLLVISSWGMVMINPGYVGDIGFQLSVAATAGVLWASPQDLTLNPSPNISQARGFAVGEGNRFLKSIGEDFKITMAAIGMTTPLILHHFGNLSVAAPVVNLLVVPVVPVVMGVAGVASVAGLAVPVLGQVVSWMAWPVLKYMTEVVNWFGSQSWSSREVGTISWWWVIGYYLALVICIKCWRWWR